MRLDRTLVGKAVQDFTGVLDNEGVWIGIKSVPIEGSWIGVANVVGSADFRGNLGCEGDVDAELFFASFWVKGSESANVGGVCDLAPWVVFELIPLLGEVFDAVVSDVCQLGAFRRFR